MTPTMINLTRSLTMISSLAVLTGLTLVISPETRANQATSSILLAQFSLDPDAADVADQMFWYFNPQLEGKRIKPDQIHYIREWMTLYEIAVRFNLPCWQCGGEFMDDLPSNWADQIADAVFYTRHRELNGRKILPGETALANEWAEIRCSINTFKTPLNCSQFGY